jgi:NADPH2 dehydrogenase
MTGIVQMKRLATIEAFEERLGELGLSDVLGVDADVEPTGPLSAPFTIDDASAGSRQVGNRFTVLPMEGWDATLEGRPTDLVRRRWRRFGQSGAKLIWGGEAVAVHPDGRANPNQLLLDADTAPAIAELRRELVEAHAERFGRTEDLVVGLQLTHSGRWSRPQGSPRPRIVRSHPELDLRVPAEDTHSLTDAELDDLVTDYVTAATRAGEAGFDFVDIKHCHGYLLHELLGAVDRPGRFGGSFEHRTAFLRHVVEGIRSAVPGLAIGVRLSAYDFAPFVADDDGVGTAIDGAGRASFAFGGDGTGTGVDLTEPHQFLDLCHTLGIGLVSVSAGSPYYNPHLQRPAYFPPSDGYAPPNDPLLDAARMIAAAAELTRAHPGVAIIGSGYSYLQQWLPHVAQRVLRKGGATSIGIGRGMLSYPELPADVLAGRPLRTNLMCRTFSDCTTAPRSGLISGCYPIDPLYRGLPERGTLATIKRRAGRRIRR